MTVLRDYGGEKDKDQIKEDFLFMLVFLTFP